MPNFSNSVLLNSFGRGRTIIAETVENSILFAKILHFTPFVAED
jgi:hypothetical protein